MPHQNKHVTKLLIADDHQIVREGFHTMLAKRNDIELVGEAVNGEELIEMAENRQPDVIITDIKMPVMDGIAATKILSDKHPEIPILAFTMYNEDFLIVDMLDAGARGYLVKNSAKEDIFEAIHAVVNGNDYYCKHTSSRLVHLIAQRKFTLRRKASNPSFNKREIEIIKLICDERANKEIADLLHLSIRTVEGYRERIQEKMEVKNTAGIVVYAIRKGIYQL